VRRIEVFLTSDLKMLAFDEFNNMIDHIAGHFVTVQFLFQ